MHRKPVQSSVLKSVGYDDVTATLEVQFIHGAVYRYLLVPKSAFAALSAADSIGAFLNHHIKPRYPVVRQA